MKGTRAEVIHEAPLSNNCPECFNQDMTLRFTQHHRENRFMHRVYKGVARELQCNTCKNVIYPVSWTEDIERSVDYYEKLVHPQRPGIRFKALFYIIIVVALAIMATLVYLYKAGIIAIQP